MAPNGLAKIRTVPRTVNISIDINGAGVIDRVIDSVKTDPHATDILAELGSSMPRA